MRSIFFLGFFLFVVGCKPENSTKVPASRASASAPTWNGDLKSLVPPGIYEAEWLGPSTTPRLLELGAAFQDAVRANPDWFMDYTKAHAKPGVALPYHEKLGLSPSEYEEMLALLKDMRLVPVDRFQITIREYNGFLQLSPSDPKYRVLDSISIDVVSGELLSPQDTPIAAARTPVGMKHSKDGPWIGLEWAYTNGDLLNASGHSVNLIIGRTPETGHVAVEYRRVIADSGVVEMNQEVHFRFRPTVPTSLPGEQQ